MDAKPGWLHHIQGTNPYTGSQWNNNVDRMATCRGETRTETHGIITRTRTCIATLTAFFVWGKAHLAVVFSGPQNNLRVDWGVLFALNCSCLEAVVSRRVASGQRKIFRFIFPIPTLLLKLITDHPPLLSNEFVCSRQNVRRDLSILD